MTGFRRHDRSLRVWLPESRDRLGNWFSCVSTETFATIRTSEFDHVENDIGTGDANGRVCFGTSFWCMRRHEDDSTRRFYSG